MKTNNIFKSKLILTLCISISIIASSCSNDDKEQQLDTVNQDFKIEQVAAKYDNVLDQIIMTMTVKGNAGNTRPTAIGSQNGAPVLGYVFPTSLSSSDVGFGTTSGIVAMALTSHPDFDDTPLWDENNDKNYLNDGLVWHAHWVLLIEDTRVKGGLSVKQFNAGDPLVVLPKTNPGMPMYMDSPGFQVVTSNKSIKVIFPTTSIKNKTNFNFDGVTAFMKVNTSNNALPLLGVYEVYNIASGNLSLPYTVQQ
jgi:hypothetical protein